MTESGFDLGLADADRAGVFFVTDDDLGGLAAAARDAGLRPQRIDLHGCATKATLLLRFATALDFPAGSGRNWDALSDSLRDLSWLPAGAGHVLLLEGASGLHRSEGEDFDTLLSILDEARAFWAGHELPFWVFVALDEADFDEMDAGP